MITRVDNSHAAITRWARLSFRGASRARNDSTSPAPRQMINFFGMGVGIRFCSSHARIAGLTVKTARL